MENKYSNAVDDFNGQMKRINNMIEFQNEPHTPPCHTFGKAIECLKAGYRVARNGWNGKGMWLELSEYDDGAIYKQLPLDPPILMKTADNKFVSWVASQTDILAEDWIIYKD